jgi:hypothetical protein
MHLFTCVSRYVWCFLEQLVQSPFFLTWLKIRSWFKKAVHVWLCIDSIVDPRYLYWVVKDSQMTRQTFKVFSFMPNWFFPVAQFYFSSPYRSWPRRRGRPSTSTDQRASQPMPRTAAQMKVFYWAKLVSRLMALLLMFITGLLPHMYFNCLVTSMLLWT